MYKRLLSFCVAVTIAVLCAGCGYLPDGLAESEVSSLTVTGVRKERVVKEAEEYLKDNYPDDEFTYVSGRSPDWAYPYYELAFTTKKYDDQEFTVYGVYPNGESTDVEIPYFPRVNTEQEFEYYDTYYTLSMVKESEMYFRNSMDGFLNDSIILKVSLHSDLYVAKEIKNNDFNKCIDNHLSFVFVNVIDEKNLDVVTEDLNNYFQYLIDKDIYVPVRYICVKPEYKNECQAKTINEIIDNKDSNLIEMQTFDICGSIHEYRKITFQNK